ncbi:MAG: hypothetical protein ACTS4U_01595 [Candidatus Hodgkinia cicadicola]
MKLGSSFFRRERKWFLVLERDFRWQLKRGFQTFKCCVNERSERLKRANVRWRTE